MARRELTLATEAQGLLVDAGCGWLLRRSRGAVETDRGAAVADSATAELGLACTLHTRRLGTHAAEFWLTLENRSAHPARIRRIALLDGSLACTGAGWDLVHGELFRAERYFDGFTLMPNRFREPVADFEGTLGLSEDTPFPALLFTHRERGTVLLGVLSQERCKPVWTLTRTAGRLRLLAADHFSGIPAIPLPAGGTFTTACCGRKRCGGRGTTTPGRLATATSPTTTSRPTPGRSGRCTPGCAGS
jgi:hypothetical protein